MHSRGPHEHELPLDRRTPTRSTGFRPYGVLGWSSGLLASLLVGCGEPSAERPGPGTAEVLSQPVSARGDSPMQSDEKAARQLLEAMIARYRAAKSYADDARVRLSYRQGGQKYVDEAPLSVVLQRPGNLHLRAYAAEVVARDGRLQAVISDPLTKNMDGQRLNRPLLAETLSLADIYADPTLTHFATAGLGGPAPQLELLLAEQPLGGLFDQATVLRLDRSEASQGNPYDALIIENDQLVYKLWIERTTLLLRRVELPAEATGLTADPEISEVRLTIELPAASFEIPSSENWQFLQPTTGPAAATGPTTTTGPLAGPLLDSGAGQGTVVRSFVPPPPPLVSPHLGRQLPEFEFLDREGEVRVSDQGSDREFTVMLWIADHTASQMAARQLQAVADRIPDAVSDKTRFLLIMAEASPTDPQATGQMLRSWSVGLPFVDDTQAIGRDVFSVREAPTLCVLGPDGVMHWFQPRVGPELAEQLTRLLDDLVEGKDVGGELRKQYETDQETYRKLLDEAGG